MIVLFPVIHGNQKVLQQVKDDLSNFSCEADLYLFEFGEQLPCHAEKQQTWCSPLFVDTYNHVVQNIFQFRESIPKISRAAYPENHDHLCRKVKELIERKGDSTIFITLGKAHIDDTLLSVLKGKDYQIVDYTIES